MESNDSVWASRFREELAQCIAGEDFAQTTADHCSFVFRNFPQPSHWDFMRQGCLSTRTRGAFASEDHDYMCHQYLCGAAGECGESMTGVWLDQARRDIRVLCPGGEMPVLFRTETLCALAASVLEAEPVRDDNAIRAAYFNACNEGDSIAACKTLNARFGASINIAERERGYLDRHNQRAAIFNAADARAAAQQQAAWSSFRADHEAWRQQEAQRPTAGQIIGGALQQFQLPGSPALVGPPAPPPPAPPPATNSPATGSSAPDSSKSWNKCPAGYVPCGNECIREPKRGARPAC